MKLLRSTICIAMLACAGLAQGATISFGLNFNDIGFDPEINYATLTISDDLINPDRVNFVVTPSSLFIPNNPNIFGIQAIYFNSNPERVASASGPSGWAYDRNFVTPITPGKATNKLPTTSAFGKFNFEYYANGGGIRQNPLQFSLSVPAGHSALDYAVNNTAGFSFLTRIAQFDNNGINEGWFASDGTPLVPIPASVWLFGTALIGFIGLSRRRII